MTCNSQSAGLRAKSEFLVIALAKETKDPLLASHKYCVCEKYDFFVSTQGFEKVLKFDREPGTEADRQAVEPFVP